MIRSEKASVSPTKRIIRSGRPPSGSNERIIRSAHAGAGLDPRIIRPTRPAKIAFLSGMTAFLTAESALSGGSSARVGALQLA